MNAACKALTSILASCCLIFTVHGAKAQAKFAIGGGGALSYSKENMPGYGIVGQGELRLNNFLSITPSVGIEAPYLAYASLVARIYVTPQLYLHAGGFVNAEGEVFSETGGGGTAGIGYMVMTTTHQTIDLNFHADIKNNNNRSLSIFGMRLIYSYSFTRLK
ncbi:hypothetical protein [Mucilaginibacter ginsenosidivorax]|uniref:Outer membrane protein beta-barrel domain-containing protein n=1 Tax=Mucilaginibacter ginsenosidivorax TaxID=862126 RepID=A0A5B8W341_9SPHI|nr:hypothetical protein [Mucilaginibacter ginsenosidivorax]QEC77362.1 hypothetical protein FSB76_15925 [Mucilaginibacter ginsenosidivorax]